MITITITITITFITSTIITITFFTLITNKILLESPFYYMLCLGDVFSAPHLRPRQLWHSPTATPGARHAAAAAAAKESCPARAAEVPSAKQQSTGWDFTVGKWHVGGIYVM